MPDYPFYAAITLVGVGYFVILEDYKTDRRRAALLVYAVVAAFFALMLLLGRMAGMETIWNLYPLLFYIPVTLMIWRLSKHDFPHVLASFLLYLLSVFLMGVPYRLVLMAIPALAPWRSVLCLLLGALVGAALYRLFCRSTAACSGT